MQSTDDRLRRAALLRITALEQRIVAVRAQYLALPRPEAHIAALLRRIAALCGTADGTTMVVDTSLIHEPMATRAGTARLTVTRVVNL